MPTFQPKKYPGRAANSMEQSVIAPPVGNSNTFSMLVTQARAMHAAQ